MELKPCPFCGHQPILDDVQFDEDGVWCVVCQVCDAEGPPGWTEMTSDKLKSIEKWNKRE